MSQAKWLTRTGLAALTLSFGALLTASPAQAATTGHAKVINSGSSVFFQAAWGQTNKLTITRSGNTLIIDDVKAIQAGKGCKAVKGDKTRVRCTTKGKPGLRAYLRDGNDTFVTRTDVIVGVDGGPGADRITGGPASDTIWSGGAGDVVYGMGGNDFIYGDGYNAGENRNAKPGRDLLSGGAGNDYIEGHSADDVIHGGAGNDQLLAGDGSDIVYGNAGKDAVHGHTGDDWIYGGPGDDTLLGHEGRDQIAGHDGDDFLSGDDAYGPQAPDQLYAGPHSAAGDTCLKLDVDIANSCEEIIRG